MMETIANLDPLFFIMDNQLQDPFNTLNPFAPPIASLSGLSDTFSSALSSFGTYMVMATSESG